MQRLMLKIDADDDGPKDTAPYCMNFFDTITPAEWEAKLAFYKDCDTLVDRKSLANALGLSANRISELMGLGALEPVSLKPLRFALEHSKACYRSYQQWLEHRRRGERYCPDRYENTLTGTGDSK